MNKGKKILLFTSLALAGAASSPAADQYFSGNGTALDSVSYGANAAGPFTSAFTDGNTWIYSGPTAGTGTGGTISVGGMTVTEDFAITAPNGTLTLNGGVNVSAGKTLDLGTQALSGALTKDGDGMLVISGSNALSSPTTLKNGSLRITNAGALGASSVVNFDSTGSGGFELASDTALNFAGTVSMFNTGKGTGFAIVADRETAGAGVAHSMTRLNVQSLATVTVKAGSNVTSGTAGLTIGTVSLGSTSGNVISADKNVSLRLNTVSTGSNTAVGRSFSVTGSGDVSIGNINTVGSGGGGLVVNMSDAGSVTLTGSGTFTGTLQLSAGTLRATTNAASLGSGNMRISGGFLELANDTDLNYGRDTILAGAARTITVDRLTAGAGVTHSLGDVDIQAGALNITKGANVTSGTAGLVFSGPATLSGTTALKTITTNASTELTFNTVSGSGYGIIKNGAGQLKLSGAGTYDGGTQINAGTLLLTDADSAGYGLINLNGGRLSTSFGSGAVQNMVYVSGSGSTYHLQRDAGAEFSDYWVTTMMIQGISTDVGFLAGTSSVATTMQTGFSAATGDLYSDIFSLDGTGSDVFVLQMSVSGLDSQLFLGWYDGTAWANAATDTSGLYAGFYNTSFDAFLASHGGTFDAESMLGAYGNDGAGNVWAVLNHNSDFAVIPEPGTWGLLGLGVGAILWGCRRRRLCADGPRLSY